MITNPVALNRFQRSMVSRRPDTCGFCGKATTPGTDFAVLNNGKWMGVCALHATSTVEQCKAMFLAIQTAAAGLDPAALTAIDEHCPADLAAVLADEADGVATVAAAIKLTDALAVARGFKPAPVAVRSNKFAGKCGACGQQVVEQTGRIEKNDAGKWITFHLDGQCPTPDVAFEAVAPVRTAEVAEGRYALRDEDGTVKFYRVEHGKRGSRWEGYVFVSAQASDDLYPIRNREHRGAILNAIAVDPTEAVALYGRELGVCGRCGKTLTSPSTASWASARCARTRLGEPLVPGYGARPYPGMLVSASTAAIVTHMTPTTTPATTYFPGVFNHPHPSEVIAVGSKWSHRRTWFTVTVKAVTFTGVTFDTPTGEHTTFVSDFMRRYEPVAAPAPATDVLTAKSIDRNIYAALVNEFGKGTNLSDVLLADIEDVIINVILTAGRGQDEAYETAERVAARLDGRVL